MSDLRIRVDLTEVARLIGKAREVIEQRVVQEVEKLSISTHAFIINAANQQFKEDTFKREFFLGLGDYGRGTSNTSTSDPRVDRTPRHVRWVKVSNGLWVVELDEKVMWLEEGRERTFMGEEWWLLKPGKAKRAKDGSLYRSIPITQTKNGEGKGRPMFVELVRQAAKEQGVSLRKLEYDDTGKLKTGVLHKLKIESRGSPEKTPSLFGKPRGPEAAQKYGLPTYAGAFKLEGAAIIQTNRQINVKTAKGKSKTINIPSREAVVFRTISSKHRAEGRWYSPAVKPFHVMKQAHDYAQTQLNVMISMIEQEFNK